QNAWIVTDGIQSGDAVILDGLKNLRDGGAIKTVPVTINAAGVVGDVAPKNAEAPQTGPTAKSE
ncbi:MAG: hypothetical protein JXR35_07580, partial [Rhodobacteraceae bacterium]|nr:hypothetical protein [Paracoccaceae bacterium]